MPKGSLTMIVGPVSTGKTSALMRRLRDVRALGKSFIVVKHALQTRHGKLAVASRDGGKIRGLVATHASEIQAYVQAKSPDVLGLDEVQFYGIDLVPIIDVLVDRGLIVIAAGLDTDFRGESFGPVPDLLAKADDVEKRTVLCSNCLRVMAVRTQRLTDGKPAPYCSEVVLFGAGETYSPRCRDCHVVPRS